MAEVGPAVEHADHRALAGVAGLPRLGEPVRLRVEDGELLELLEVGPGQRRRIRVRHLFVVQLPEDLVLRGGVRPVAELRIRHAVRLPGLLEVDRADGYDVFDAGEFG